MPPSFAHAVGGSTWSDRGPVLGTLLAGVAIIVGLVLVLPEREPWQGTELDPEGFLAAYERSRTEELLVTSTFTRRLNDGRELAYEVRDIRRPPDDVLVAGAGSVSGRLDGHVHRCNVQVADDPPSCIQGPEAPPFEDEVAAAVDAMRAAVTGYYEAEAAGDGCWDLLLVRALLSAPYGGAARFCFDEATGALRYREVRRPEGVDVLEATEIRTEVTDADLRAPALGEPIATG